MLGKSLGIILHVLKYSDTSNIVDIYTEQYGRLSFLVPITRNRKKKPSLSLLMQPLSIVSLDIDLKVHSTLHKINEVTSAYTFETIPYDPKKSAIVFFLAEFLYRVVREEESNLPLFAYMQHSIVWLDMCTSNTANFHLVFLMRLTRFLGLFPNVEDPTEYTYFDMQNACLVDSKPIHGLFLDKKETNALLLLIRMNYDTMHLFKMNREDRMKCLAVIEKYYRIHLPDFPELKSLQILKELFD